MCGICGILAPEPVVLGRHLACMNDAQRHRGPDGEGYYLETGVSDSPGTRRPGADARGICGLAHRRLAILDPLRGCQPMISAGGRAVAVLNGEVFNFQSLRGELDSDYPFCTDSDTEVLLALYEREPDHPERWLRRLNGIFALAIWDRQRRRLLLARDPFGVKPLHVARKGGALLFASEIKALLAAGVKPQLNKSALHLFLNVRYVPGEQTLFAGVERFPPAHFAWVRDGAMRQPSRFVDPPWTGSRFAGTRSALCAALRETYDTAVRDQLLSDVPVGISLSGGLDSSMNVAAAHQALCREPGLRAGDGCLRTFSLGFNEPTDELDDARLVADLFSTRHVEACLSANPLDRMAEVIRAVEEPKVNMIQGYMLAELARGKVKVLLGGLGGDELFAGYTIHRFCNTLGRGHAFVPGGVQRAALQPLSRLWWHLQTRVGRLRFEHYRIGGQIALSLGDRAQFYTRLRNAWDADRGMYARLYARPGDFLDRPTTASVFEPWFDGIGDFLEAVLRAEFATKMVDDFLLNEDRVMSAHGVEGRVPFLDPRLVSLAFSVPAREKMRGAGTKALWKDCIGSTLPPAILNKQKQGFTFSSYHQWQKDLKAVVERELTPAWCTETGLFNARFVRDVLDYPPHPNLRWHYFMVWMMLGVKTWLEVFNVDPGP